MQSSNAHSTEVGFEPAEVVHILADRCWPQPTVGDQVLEESRHRFGKRVVAMTTAYALEARNNELQQLLDRSAHFFGHLLRSGAVLPLAPMAANALGHVRVDMSWQLAQFCRPSLVRELYAAGAQHLAATLSTSFGLPCAASGNVHPALSV